MTTPADSFLAAVNTINTGPDGFPNNPAQTLEITVMARWANQILDTNLEHAGDPVPYIDGAVVASARSWLDLLATCRDGIRDPDIAAAWFKARAQI